MKIITVSNQKGGVGKTTTAVSLAACLADRGERVLLVDLDPQANATEWLGGEEGSRAVLRILTELEPVAGYVIGSNTAGVDLLPGSKWSASAEARLSSDLPIPDHPVELRLRHALAKAEGYDVAIIDTPPGLGWLSSNGVHAADLLVIPVEAHIMALAAVARLLESIDLWEITPEIRFLPVRIDRRDRHMGEVVELLREKYGDQVTRTEIRKNIRIAEAWGWRKPVTVYAPKSPGAMDYRATTDELFTRTKSR